jgi:GDPmannose 4,6-dehydratase
MSKALITGVNGQDGILMADFLLKKGYEVVGISRKFNKIHQFQKLISSLNLHLLEVDIRNAPKLNTLIKSSNFDEVYNFAGVSSVKESFSAAAEYKEINVDATWRLFKELQRVSPNTRIFHSSSSEMYGANKNYPFDELSELNPMSPYAISKTELHLKIDSLLSENLFISRGIMFNHESKLRDNKFLSARLCREFKKILQKEQDHFSLGNLNARRDWSYAGDFMEGIWKSLQQAEPVTFVLASGVDHSVLEFADEIRKQIGLTQETTSYLEVDEGLFRTFDADVSVGNPTKAILELNWKISRDFSGLVEKLLDNDNY